MQSCVFLPHGTFSSGYGDQLQGSTAPPLLSRGRGYTDHVTLCFHLPPCSRCSFEYHVAFTEMSPSTVAAFSRALRAGGNGTFARSPQINRLSTTCSLSGETQQGREVTQSRDSTRPSVDAHSAVEPPNRCPSADKKPKEPMGAPGVSGVRRRSYTSTAVPVDSKSFLWARYNDTKRLVHGKHRVPHLLSACAPRLGAARALCCCELHA